MFAIRIKIYFKDFFFFFFYAIIYYSLYCNNMIKIKRSSIFTTHLSPIFGLNMLKYDNKYLFAVLIELSNFNIFKIKMPLLT